MVLETPSEDRGHLGRRGILEKRAELFMCVWVCVEGAVRKQTAEFLTVTYIIGFLSYSLVLGLSSSSSTLSQTLVAFGSLLVVYSHSVTFCTHYPQEITYLLFHQFNL